MTQPFALPCFIAPQVAPAPPTVFCEVGSAVSPAASCALFSATCGARAQVAWLRRDSNTYQTVCANGFALAATVDGASDVFRYDSSLWISNDQLTPSLTTLAQFMGSNAKTHAFSETNASFIALVNYRE